MRLVVGTRITARNMEHLALLRLAEAVQTKHNNKQPYFISWLTAARMLENHGKSIVAVLVAICGHAHTCVKSRHLQTDLIIFDSFPSMYNSSNVCIFNVGVFSPQACFARPPLAQSPRYDC